MNEFKNFMNEITINSDLDVLQLMDNEESPELAYIYTALFMIGKGMDFDVDEEFKGLVKQSVDGCAALIAAVGGRDEK